MSHAFNLTNEWVKINDNFRVAIKQKDSLPSINLIELANEAFRIAKDAMQQDSLAVAMRLENLQNISHWLVGKQQDKIFFETETIFLKAIEIIENAIGSDHMAFANNLILLADLYYLNSKQQNAEKYYLHALTIFQKSKSPNHKDISILLIKLGHVYEAMNKTDLARKYCYQAISLSENEIDDDIKSLSSQLRFYAQFYLEQNQTQCAEVYLKRAIAVFENRIKPDQKNICVAMDDLAKMYYDQKLYDKAEHYYLKIGCYTGLALVYTAQGNFEQAKQLYEMEIMKIEQVSETDAAPPGKEYWLGWAKIKFGDFYFEQKKYAEAKSLYDSALGMLAVDDYDLLPTMENLLFIHKATHLPIDSLQKIINKLRHVDNSY